MKCVLLIATAILCQLVIGTTAIRRRRGYYNHDVDYSSRGEGPPLPSWWPDTVDHNTPKQDSTSLKGWNNPYGLPYNERHESNDEVITRPIKLPLEDSKGIHISWSPPWSSSGTGSSFSKPSSPPSTDKIVNNEEVSLCFISCPVTTEYSPVCGTNNVTYTNLGRLECAQRCGIVVQLKRLTSCSVPESITTEKTLSREEVVACIRQCPITGEYNPVCGSNNVTYVNPGQLECEKNCGIQVELNKLTACIVPKPSTSSSTTTTQKTLSKEEQTAACFRTCPVTGEYNPVCGSNNITYANPGRLECAQTCGVDVKIIRETSCNAPLTDEEIKKATSDSRLTTSTARPYVNENGGNNVNGNDEGENSLNSGNNGSLEKDDDGQIGGIDGNNNGQNNINWDINGNKGNNGNRGNNSDGEINKNTGYNGDGQSNGYGDHNLNNENKENGSNHGNHGNNQGNVCDLVNNKKTPSVKEVLACMQLCILTSEYNPVCGTDDITYMNPGRLLCAQYCGIDVKVKKFAPCTSDGTTNFHCHTTCTNPPVNDKPETTPATPSIEACMNACPASLEFFPVCGSNNVTYRNLEKLQCARRCGIDVSLRKKTHCSVPNATPPNGNSNLEKPTDPSSIQKCIEQCSVKQKYEPICGTDDITYNNGGHLICARQCGLNVRVKEYAPCSVSPTPNPLADNGKVTSGPTGLNFTIPSGVLDNIWPTPKDESEEFELDERVQDQQ